MQINLVPVLQIMDEMVFLPERYQSTFVLMNFTVCCVDIGSVWPLTFCCFFPAKLMGALRLSSFIGYFIFIAYKFCMYIFLSNCKKRKRNCHWYSLEFYSFICYEWERSIRDLEIYLCLLQIIPRSSRIPQPA